MNNKNNNTSNSKLVVSARRIDNARSGTRGYSIILYDNDKHFSTTIPNTTGRGNQGTGYSYAAGEQFDNYSYPIDIDQFASGANNKSRKRRNKKNKTKSTFENQYDPWNIDEEYYL